MPREIEVKWTTSNGAEKVSVLYFDTGTAVAAQRDAIDSMLTGVAGALDTGTSYVIATEGREWNNATGALTGAWTEPTAYVGAGTVGGEPVPDVCQILMRWSTGTIVDGRFLAGRTYIPGCARVNDLDGNLDPAIASGTADWGQTLCDADVGFQIWHRPTSGAGGSVALVGTCSVWTEFAVLRKRRY